MTSGVQPAHDLVGRDLADGWRVTGRVARQGSTGGCFSVGYIVERAGGERGFLKALDYSQAFAQEVNTAEALKLMTTEFICERTLVERCGAHRMDRVVRAIGAGEVTVHDQIGGKVDYLIFELATGDIRSLMQQALVINEVWALRALHHISTGLKQLHKAEIAHLDVKPSNVMVFPGNESKVGDLGRAVAQFQASPHDSASIAGAQAYAPPEALYNAIPADWGPRRYGCDLYLLGSMVTFLFATVTMNGLLFATLDESFCPANWKGTYVDVLPHLRNAFGLALDQFATSISAAVRERLVIVVRTLCDPDPLLRGHTSDRSPKGNAYSLERYVTEFDLLRRHAEIGMRGGTP
jgi:serine/threonine protein kinase